MENFILLLIVIICLLLGLVILIQNPKGGGLAVGFQGAAPAGGVQQTADFLEKATRYLAVALFALCMLSAYVYKKDTPLPVVPTEQTTTAPGGGTETPANPEQP